MAGEPAGVLQSLFQLLLGVIDVADDELAGDDHGDGKEHAGGAEQFATDDDAEYDGHRVEIQRVADERRIDEIMVRLREYQVENDRLGGYEDIDCGRQDDSEGRGDRRSEHRDEFADAGEHGEHGGIGQSAHRVVEEYDGAGYQADDELAADIDGQRIEYAVEQGQYAGIVAAGEQTGEVAFDLFAILYEVEGDEDDDDHIDEAAEQLDDHGER